MLLTNKKDIHQQALNWEASTAIALHQSEVRAWNITKIMTLLAVLAITGLVFMLPFYKVIPMTFLVDKVTGEAQLVDTTGYKPASLNEAADRHWVEEYVNTRERYNWMLLQSDYERTLALSAGDVLKNYRAMFGHDNALDKQLGNYTERRIHIVSTTLPPGAQGTAIIRYERTTRERGYDTEIAGKYIASMTYVYEKPSLLTLQKDLDANPYGFKVTGYVVDKEEKGAAVAAPIINAPQSLSPSANGTSQGANGVSAQ
jgi:type IV secretion system protein VirB8